MQILYMLKWLVITCDGKPVRLHVSCGCHQVCICFYQHKALANQGRNVPAVKYYKSPFSWCISHEGPLHTLQEQGENNRLWFNYFKVTGYTSGPHFSVIQRSANRRPAFLWSFRTDCFRSLFISADGIKDTGHVLGCVPNAHCIIGVRRSGDLIQHTWVSFIIKMFIS